MRQALQYQYYKLEHVTLRTELQSVNANKKTEKPMPIKRQKTMANPSILHEGLDFWVGTFHDCIIGI
jgi:hypothetical protein